PPWRSADHPPGGVFRSRRRPPPGAKLACPTLSNFIRSVYIKSYSCGYKKRIKEKKKNDF
ncbi:MAG: hypothetical protein ACTSRS_03345, partial [Candidatus Helarchaeota archaeon]